MLKTIVFCSFFMLFLIPAVSFAQSTYVIKIPTGAADPNAPYFWSSQKDGSTTGDIEIVPGDSVKWSNADTAAHTVTSGSLDTGHDGIFDSGMITQGKSFTHTFDELGKYPYYCSLHPWMKGIVFVIKGFQVIPDVGSTVGDGSQVFDIEYKFNRVVSVSSIDVNQKSILFELLGNAKSDDHTLVLNIPTALLGGPYVVWADGKEITDFEITTGENGKNINSLTVPLTEKSKVLTMVGTTIVPEFGTIAVLVFGVSVISILVIRLKTNLTARF